MSGQTDAPANSILTHLRESKEVAVKGNEEEKIYADGHCEIAEESVPFKFGGKVNQMPQVSGELGEQTGIVKGLPVPSTESKPEGNIASRKKGTLNFNIEKWEYGCGSDKKPEGKTGTRAPLQLQHQNGIVTLKVKPEGKRIEKKRNGKGEEHATRTKKRLAFQTLKDEPVDTYRNRTSEHEHLAFESLQDAKRYFRRLQREMASLSHLQAGSQDHSVDARYHQVGKSFAEDEFYHFVNIDDFDDTKEVPIKTKKNKKGAKKAKEDKGLYLYSLEYGQPLYKRAQDMSKDVAVENLYTEENLRSYFLQEVLRGAKKIRCCCRPDCPDVFDNKFVFQVLAKSPAAMWTIKSVIGHWRMEAHWRIEAERRNQAITKQAESQPSPNEAQNNTAEATAFLAKEVAKPKSKWRRWREYGRKKNSQKLKKDVRKGIQQNKTAHRKTETPLEPQELLPLKAFTGPECNVCFDDYKEDLVFRCKSCDFFTCTRCLKEYFRERFNHLDPCVQCPSATCERRYDPTEILDILGKEKDLQERYLKLTMEQFLLRNEETRKCPGPGCPFAILCPGGRCPIECGYGPCGIKYCADCQQPWEMGDDAHAPHECKSRKVEESWMRTANVKPCPKCGAVVMKIDDGSCNQMQCKYCKEYFCWVCAKMYTDLHVFDCPLWGNMRFSLRRRIGNYLTGGLLIGVGVPVFAGLLLGAVVTFGAGVVTAGVITSPAVLARQMYNRERQRQSSKLRRWLATFGGASLGLIGMPLTSVWGVYQVLKGVKAALVALDEKLDEILGDDEDETDDIGTDNVVIEMCEKHKDKQKAAFENKLMIDKEPEKKL